MLIFDDTTFKTHCSDKQEETIDEPIPFTKIISPRFWGNIYLEVNHQILSRSSWEECPDTGPTLGSETTFFKIAQRAYPRPYPFAGVDARSA